MCKSDVKEYINFIISSDEEKVKIGQYTCKEFQLFLERVLYYNFYQNQEGYRQPLTDRSVRCVF